MSINYSLFTNDAAGEKFKVRLMQIREGAKPILDLNLHVDFTDHSVGHSDSVAANASLLGSALIINHRLTNEEAFILYAACYLHDIGMEYEPADDLQSIRELGLPVCLRDMQRAERVGALRRIHNVVSAGMVAASRDAAVPPIGTQLSQDDQPQLIASLCEAHLLAMDGVDRLRYTDLMGGTNNVRMALLSGILRLADILDEGSWRALQRRQAALILPIESQAHWYRLRYTREVRIDPAKGRISILFEFPHGRRADYEELVCDLAVPEMEKELARHASTFAAVGLGWSLDYEVSNNPYSDAEEMPDTVALEMSGMLRARRATESDEVQRAVLRDFEAAQPFILRLQSNVEAIPPDNLSAKREALRDLYSRLDRVGASASATAVLHQLFNTFGEPGFEVERFAFGERIVAAESQVENHTVALHVARICLDISTRLTIIEQLKAETMVARALGAQCTEGAPEAYRRAIALGTDIDMDLTHALNSELAEFELLAPKPLPGNGSLPPGSNADATGTEPLEPSLRAEIARSHFIARRDGPGPAIIQLRTFAQSTGHGVYEASECALTENTIAWIQYLSGDAEAACETLARALALLPLSTHPGPRATIDGNIRLAELGRRVPFIRHHALALDERRITGTSNRTSAELREGITALMDGNLLEAAHELWRELQNAYAAGEWTRYRVAARYFARILTESGRIGDALRYALEAYDSDLAVEAVSKMVSTRDSQLLADAVTHMTGLRLQRHIVPAIMAIEIVSDSMPDNCVGDAFDFLMQYVGTELVLLADLDAARPAWRAIAALGSRLTPAQAYQVLQYVSSFDLGRVNEMVTLEILRTLDSILGTLPVDHLEGVASLALPLTVARSPFDGNRVRAALGVLASVAHLAGEDVRVRVAENLHEITMKSRPSPLIVQALAGLGKLPNTAWLAGAVSTTIADVRSQVRIEDGPPQASALQPAPCAGMARSEPLADGKHAVVSTGCTQYLDACVSARDAIAPDDVSRLISVCLDMAEMHENSTENRVNLLFAISQLSVRLDGAANAPFALRLTALASGSGVAQSHFEQQVASGDRLSSVQLNYLDPRAIAGAAMCCLVAGPTTKEIGVEDTLIDSLTAAIVSPHVTLRNMAIFATNSLQSVEGELLTALVFALRDPDDEVVVNALLSLSKKTSEVDEFHYRAILMSLHSIKSHDNVRVRISAAHLARTLAEAEEIGDAAQTDELAGLMVDFANDTSYAVRREASTGWQHS